MALSHKGKRLSLDPNLNIKFYLVGSEFEPIFHNSIFTLSSAFMLQILEKCLLLHMLINHATATKILYEIKFYVCEKIRKHRLKGFLIRLL